MEDFPFKLILKYNDKINNEINPPFNYTLLTDLIKKKLNLKKIQIYYFDKEGIENEIKNDNDYINFINYFTNENSKEIEIIIINEEKIKIEKKKKYKN